MYTNSQNKIERVKNKISQYKKNTLPILYELQDKLEAIISSLEESSPDCIILNDDYNLEFEQLMLELEILSNQITNLNLEINNHLLTTSNLLGEKYFEKLIEFQSNAKEKKSKKPVKEVVEDPYNSFVDTMSKYLKEIGISTKNFVKNKKVVMPILNEYFKKTELEDKNKFLKDILKKL
jgi:ADP-glucose pyrophosphorylase